MSNILSKTKTTKKIQQSDNNDVLKGTTIFIIKPLGCFEVWTTFLFFFCVFSFFFYLHPFSQFKDIENYVVISSE